MVCSIIENWTNTVDSEHKNIGRYNRLMLRDIVVEKIYEVFIGTSLINKAKLFLWLVFLIGAIKSW